MASPRGFLSFIAATAVVACGGFLGFGDDEDDAPIPGGPGSEAGADTATGTTDVDGGDPPRDASVGDGDLGDVVIVVPPIDASVDGPADQVFPRLATFESGTLTLPNGADVNDGMDLLNSGTLKGAYSAQTKNASASVGFTFAAKPTQEIFVAFLFRFDAATSPQMPAAFFRLALPGGANILAAIQSDGDIYVGQDSSSAKKIATVAVGAVHRFGLHARVSPAALEAVVVPDGPFTGAVPVNVGWAAPAPILGASVGELSGSSMRITVDQIGFNETGLDK